MDPWSSVGWMDDQKALTGHGTVLMLDEPPWENDETFQGIHGRGSRGYKWVVTPKG